MTQTKIKTIKHINTGERFAPRTHIKAVLDSSGNSLESLLNIQTEKISDFEDLIFTVEGDEEIGSLKPDLDYDAVRKSAQLLTSQEQQQVRSNIGAASLLDINRLNTKIDNIEPIVNNGTINNAVDEEDLTTNAENLISLKDRTTDNGMGYVILRRNKGLQEQMTQINTIYEIRYDFNLLKSELNIPENCVLKFEGGSIGNGTVKFNNTLLTGKPSFKDATFSTGALLNKEVEINWFGVNNTGSVDVTSIVNNLTTNVFSSVNVIKFSGTYLFTNRAIDIVKDTGNNTYVKLMGPAKFIVSDNNHYLIRVHCCNIDIENINIECTDSSAQSQWHINDETINELKSMSAIYLYGTGTLNVSDVNMSHIWGNSFTLTFGFRNINFKNIRLVDCGGRITTMSNDSRGDAIYFNFDTWTSDKSPIFIDINNFYMYGKYNSDIEEFSRCTFKFELLTDRLVKNPANIIMNVDNLYSYGTNNVIDIEGFMDTNFNIEVKNSVLDKHRKIIYVIPGDGFRPFIKSNFNNVRMTNIGGNDFVSTGVNAFFVSYVNDELYLDNCTLHGICTFGGVRSGNIYMKNTSIESIRGWWVDGVNRFYAQNCKFKVDANTTKLITNLIDSAVFENCRFEADGSVSVALVTDSGRPVKFMNCAFSNVSGMSNETTPVASLTGSNGLMNKVFCTAHYKNDTVIQLCQLWNKPANVVIEVCSISAYGDPNIARVHLMLNGYYDVTHVKVTTITGSYPEIVYLAGQNKRKVYLKLWGTSSSNLEYARVISMVGQTQTDCAVIDALPSDAVLASNN